MKPKKYKYKVREVEFLGVVIKLDKIKIVKVEVKIVLDQLVSKSAKEIQKFLGLVNYYRQFVKDFAKIVKPLYKLTKKEQK